jgi:hypothetical protein
MSEYLRANAIEFEMGELRLGSDGYRNGIEEDSLEIDAKINKLNRLNRYAFAFLSLIKSSVRHLRVIKR